MRSKSSAGDRRAFHKALSAGHVAIVRTMLDEGMPADALHGGIPPLFLAATGIKPELIDMLVEAGADPNQQMVGRANDYGCYRTALHGACAWGGRLPNVAKLLDHGADPTMLNDAQCNAAHVLLSKTSSTVSAGAEEQLCGLLERMLDLGVPVNARDAGGSTLLHRAARHLPYAGLQLLVARGADPMVANNAGWTPLMNACMDEHATGIAFLLGLGVKVNCITPLGSSLLHIVDDPECLALLFAAGADLEQRNTRGDTPLTAYLSGWKWLYHPDEPPAPSKALALIIAGADLDSVGREGVTGRELIIRDNISELSSFLTSTTTRI